MTRSKTLAIIPARGGSKRLPRKNIIPLKGIPLICWTIESALKSEEFDKIIVSSDDTEILEIAGKYEISLHQRERHLATDESRVIDVCNNILNTQLNYEKFCVLYPTAPLRKAQDIRGTVGLLQPPTCNFSIAVTDYDLPPHQALIENQGFLKPKWPELVNKRSNNVEKMFVDNGSTYACVTERFYEEQTFYGVGLKGHLMPRESSVDLDTPEDLAYLEYLLSKNDKEENAIE